MLPVRDNEFNRDYYGAEVQFRPTLNGSAFKPYAAGVQVGGDGWIYKWDRYGLDRTQFDVKWTAGLSYRF